MEIGILRVDPPEIIYMPDEVIARFVSGKLMLELSSSYGAYGSSLEREIRRFRAHQREREKHAVLPFNVCPHLGRPCGDGALLPEH